MPPSLDAKLTSSSGAETRITHEARRKILSLRVLLVKQMYEIAN